MKQHFTHLYLLATCLLLSLTSRAQYTQTITGSLSRTSSAAPWHPELNNTALCNQLGSVDAVGASDPIYHFASHLIRNAGTATTCLTVTLTASCADMRSILLVSAYTPTYDYATPLVDAAAYHTMLANYRGNPGAFSYSSPGSIHTTSFPLQLAAGASAQLIVSAYDINTYCSAYTITVTSAQPLPVLAAQPATPLTFYPNPVTNQATFNSPCATTLTVRDPLGRVVRMLSLPAGTQQVSLEQLPAGVYALTDESTHQTMRFVKAAQ